MTYIAIGCSFTENMYPTEHDSWPECLSYKIKDKVINYGVRGSGLNYAARTMYETFYKHKPKGYFIGLSQWDRKEIGKFKLVHSKWPLKTKHMRPKDNDKFSQYIKSELKLNDIDVLDPEWVINQAAYNVLSMIHFCENNNLELYIHQLLWPLHASVGQIPIVKKFYNSSLWSEISNKIHWTENEDYLFCDKKMYLPYSKKDKSIDLSDEIIICKFTRYNSTHTLGFHNLPGSNGEYKNVYDTHPNAKGHELIANIFYEKWKNGQSINT